MEKKKTKAIWSFKSYVAAPSNTKFYELKPGMGLQTKVTRSIALSSSSESLVRLISQYGSGYAKLHMKSCIELQTPTHLSAYKTGEVWTTFME